MLETNQTYTLYLHRNKINNKVYIGLTKFTLHKRWLQHCRKARYHAKNNKLTHFQAAIIKYGVNSWEHLELEKIIGLNLAELAESKWIAKYNSNNSKFGYNKTIGGNVSFGAMIPEIRAKISKKAKEQMADPIRKEKHRKFMKQWLKENGNPFKGKHHTEEYKERARLARLGKFTKEKNPFFGKTHTEEVKLKLSKISKDRCTKPGWVAPLARGPIKQETREKMRLAKLGKNTGKISKEKLLEVLHQNPSRKAAGQILGCTASNICYLIKKFNLKGGNNISTKV